VRLDALPPQQAPHQMLIDGAQPAHTHSLPKLMEHGNCATSRLSECVDVKAANKWVRHSCAALKAYRRPPVKPRGQTSATKSSGA